MSVQRIEGDVEHGFADADVNRPVKIGGRARRTNPTAVFDTERVEAMFDDVGRQVMTVHQVRDLISTTYATTSIGAEVTLLAGVEGVFLDLVQIIAANASSAAVTVDIRDAAAGNVVTRLTIPANTTTALTFAVPIPQSNSGNDWTIDNTGSDVSGTDLAFTATFVRNV